MIAQNEAEFKKLNISYWWSKGFTGKGGTIVVLDDIGMSNSHNKVVHPFDDFKPRAGHMTNVSQVIREVAPDVNIIAFHFGSNRDKEIIDWIIEHQDEINAINISLDFKKGSSSVKELGRLENTTLPVFVASGNHNDSEMLELAQLPWVFTIGAWQENNDKKASYSQYGEALNFVTYSHLYIPTEQGDSKLYFFSGTSCSTPVATSMLVIYDSFRMGKGFKKLTRQEAFDFMLLNVDDKLTPGKDNESGYGLFRLPYEIPQLVTKEDPEEEQSMPEKSYLYRVLLDWNDWSTQIGAFSNLNNAKVLADKNPKYKVFDPTGYMVYQSKESVTTEIPKEEEEKEHDKTNHYLIALDDGHGIETAGKRTPAISELNNRAIRENEFNRAVVSFLDGELKRCGFKTLLVAPTDIDTSLEYRVTLANNAKASAFISIHYNAMTGKFTPNGPSGHSIHIYPGSVEGRKLAQNILTHLVKGTPQKNRGIVEQNLYVTRMTKMPAILSENGFMDDKREALLMIDVDFQKEVAREHAMGICDYFKVPYIKETTTVTPPPSKPAEPVTPEVGHYPQDLSIWAKKGYDFVVEKNISDGTGPTNPVTREEVWTMLERMANGNNTPIIPSPVPTPKPIPQLSQPKKIRRFDSNIFYFETTPAMVTKSSLGARYEKEKVSKIVTNLLKDQEVLVGINAGFFSWTKESESMGLYIADGLYYNPPNADFLEFTYYKNGKAELTNMTGYDQKILANIQANAHFAIGVSYSLLQNGVVNLQNKEKFPHYENKEPRTMIGQKADGTIVLAVADGRSTISKGLTAQEQAEVMKEIGCQMAGNLDGGGSSTFVEVVDGRAKVLNAPSNVDNAERAIGSMIYVALKK